MEPALRVSRVFSDTPRGRALVFVIFCSIHRRGSRSPLEGGAGGEAGAGGLASCFIQSMDPNTKARIPPGQHH
jgi:hypothetical protein